MRSVRLTVAYDGTDFRGWQAQPGQRTVQGELGRALARVCGCEVEVRGAARTDAGVHALGQVAAFDSPRELTARRWVLALNGYLPADISVRDAAPCAPGYRPRFDARDKTYRYLMHLGVAPDPLLRRTVWHLGSLVPRTYSDPDSLEGAVHRMDLDAMRRAAGRLVGKHDFRAFRASNDPRDNTIRTLHEVDIEAGWRGQPEVVALRVRGDAFLKNMVRILAGTLMDVGRGRLGPDEVQALLEPDAERAGAGMTAPPHGLTLVEVRLGRTRSAASR